MPATERPAAVMGADATPATGSLREYVLDRCMVEELRQTMPALENPLAILRDKHTKQPEFERALSDTGFMLGIRLAQELPLVVKRIETPLETTEVRTVDGSRVLLVAVLRSGYGLCTGIQRAIPDARIGLIDIKRKELADGTVIPELHYNGLENVNPDDFDLVVFPDPMLATGGSGEMAGNELEKMGFARYKFKFMSAIAAPEGVVKLSEAYPHMGIITAALDERLDENSYIRPGLGDCGDRANEGFQPDYPNYFNKVYVKYATNDQDQVRFKETVPMPDDVEIPAIYRRTA